MNLTHVRSKATRKIYPICGFRSRTNEVRISSMYGRDWVPAEAFRPVLWPTVRCHYCKGSRIIDISDPYGTTTRFATCLACE